MGKYFSINELCKSQVANKYKINNTPNDKVISNLNKLITNILDPLREQYDKPIIVTSGYRCSKLNDVLKGSPTSQHKFGEAADIKSKDDTTKENKKLFDLIVELNLPFDQLIDEYNYNWIHVSYSDRCRKQILHIN